MNTERFKLVFYAVLLLTISCGVSLAAIIIWGPNPSPPQVTALVEPLKMGLSGGLATIFSLLANWPTNKRKRRTARSS